MAIKFKVIKRMKPGDKEAPGKYYAQATVSGEVTLDTLARRIAKASMAARGDVQGVLTSLVDEIIESLEEGNTVKIGELGCMRISVSSSGMTNASDVSANSVKKARIIYTPSVMLKDRITRLSFHSLPVYTGTTGESDGDKPSEL